MRNRFLLFSVIALCAACMKDDPYTKECTLTTGSQPAPASGTVTYEVTQSGSVYVNSITYQAASGPVTVDKPALPFTISITVQQNAPVGMQVKGTAIDGVLKIRHALVTGKDTVMVQDACEG